VPWILIDLVDEVDWSLDWVGVAVFLPLDDDDSSCSPLRGAVRTGGFDRKFLSWARAWSTSGVHTNFSWCLSSLKKGSPRSPSFEINMFKAVMHPVSF
jgi:hypothetical protein